MNSIAAIMQVLNESEFVEASIQSIQPFVEQVVVIDQGSTDGSQDILKRLGVTTIHTQGQNYLTNGERFFQKSRRRGLI